MNELEDISTRQVVPLRSWWMLAVLLLFYVLSFLDRLLLSMMVEPLKQELQLSEFQVGLLLGPAFAFCYAFLAIPCGWASDRFPRRWVIYGGVSLWSLATMASSQASSFETLLMARMFVGIGEAALLPAAYSLIADGFPRHRLTSALAIFAMGPKFGQMLAFTLGGLVLGLAAAGTFNNIWPLSLMRPWQVAFALAGAPGALLAFLVFTFPDRGRGQPTPASPGKSASLYRYVRRNKSLMASLTLGFGCMAMIAGALPMWTPTFLARQFQLSPADYGPALGISSIMSAATLLPLGIFVDWIYKRGLRDAHVRVYTWILTIVMPLGVFTFLIPDPYLFLAAYCVLYALAVSYMLNLSATIQLFVPFALRGRVTGLFLLPLVGLGAGFGPALVASMTEFVFQDPAKLGLSLAIVTSICLIGALTGLRWSLLPLRKAQLEVEQRASLS